MLSIHLELLITKELSSHVFMGRDRFILKGQVILRSFGVLRLEVILWLLCSYISRVVEKLDLCMTEFVLIERTKWRKAKSNIRVLLGKFQQTICFNSNSNQAFRKLQRASKYWPASGEKIELLATVKNPSDLSDWKSLALRVQLQIQRLWTPSPA